MTGPAIPQDDPMLRLRYYRETGQDDEAKHYEQYLRETGQFPGAFSRGLSQLGQAVGEAVHHPLQTLETAIVAPIKSAFNAAIAPGVGEARHDPRLSKGGNSSGRAIDTSPYDAAHGGITPRERTAAGVQTVANLAAPSIFGGAKSLLAPGIGKTLATGVGLAASGAATGAAYNPNDPAAGAVAGGVAAPIVGGVASGASQGAVKITDLLRNANRIRTATPIDEAAVAHSQQVEDASRANYGAAAAEGDAVGGTTPALRAALEHPRVKEYADRFRKSDRGASADDATVARETYKLMSKVRRGIQKRMDTNGYDADLDLERDNLASAMKRLKDATAAPSTKPALTLDVAPEVFETEPTIERGHGPRRGPVLEGTAGRARGTSSQVATDPNGRVTSVSPRDVQGPAGPAFQLAATPDRVTPGVRIETPAMRVQTAPPEDVGPAMPSFPKAVSERARMGRERDLFNRGVDASKRFASGKQPAAKKLDTQSEAAILRDVNAMQGQSPAEAEAMLRGVLGGAKEEVGFHLPTMQSPSLVGNAIQPLLKVNRLSPLIDALDRQAGRAPSVPHRLLDPLSTDDVLRLIGIPVGSTVNP